MPGKLLSLLLAFAMLADLTACDTSGGQEAPPSSPTAVATTVQAPDVTQSAAVDGNESGESHENNVGPENNGDPASGPDSSPETPVGPPAPPELDHTALAGEILSAILGDDDAPNAAEAVVTEEHDPITERPQIELAYPVGEGQVVVTLDKETGRLERLDCSDGLIKLAQYTDPEAMAKAWYDALPFPRGYTLCSSSIYLPNSRCYEFNRAVTLETDGGPVEVFSPYEAVRIMIDLDTGELEMANAFYWPLFDGYPEKKAISEAEAVKTARQYGSYSGEDTLTSKLTLYQPLAPISVAGCPLEQSTAYSFPAWSITFHWDGGDFPSEAQVYVDLYTGEVLGVDHLG